MASPSAYPPPEDEEYIRARFISLSRLATLSHVPRAVLTDWQNAALFPRPTYVTADGSEWYPPAYASAIRRARARTLDLRQLFRQDFSRTLDRLRRTDPAAHRVVLLGPGGMELSPEEAIESEWQGFLTGGYGVCLRVAWVPCIVRKGLLMHSIEELTAHPAREDPTWGRRLRAAVDSLDRLELPFARWDRIRFGRPVTRDTHVDAVRARFPEVFGRRARAPEESASIVGLAPSDDVPC